MIEYVSFGRCILGRVSSEKLMILNYKAYIFSAIFYVVLSNIMGRYYVYFSHILDQEASKPFPLSQPIR